MICLRRSAAATPYSSGIPIRHTVESNSVTMSLSFLDDGVAGSSVCGTETMYGRSSLVTIARPRASVIHVDPIELPTAVYGLFASSSPAALFIRRSLDQVSPSFSSIF
ncbi:hypothetical protein KP509_12G018900 [Ceratopteris richardii]|uniref:Uncharacterized protein n=1 Tax=Ceratopteris richardii TaxID=49495 RepID=A0A8T2TJ40_CERRI|nr:hypothetical protein KP509_12G018900 [Ceratopteris richardii]